MNIENLIAQLRQKDGLIYSLEVEISRLREENQTLKSCQKTNRAAIKRNRLIIRQHKETIKKLTEENTELKTRINHLEKEIGEMRNEKLKFDALVKLHECSALVNKAFKNAYKLKFNKKRGDYIPNVGDFIKDPPNDEKDPDYEFWFEFKETYPKTDDPRFRSLYCKMSNDRAECGAHVDVSNLTRFEFDNLVKIVYPTEYAANKELYDEYRNWLFLFPA